MKNQIGDNDPVAFIKSKKNYDALQGKIASKPVGEKIKKNKI
jgi:pyruvate/2-oxoglutarate/acetoin dehydrogenase E1 component